MMLFLPELVLLAAGLVIFFSGLMVKNSRTVKKVAVVFAALTLLAALIGLKQHGELFFASYRVDAFSQAFKALIAAGFFLVVLFTRELPAIERRWHNEYFLFLFMSVLGMMMLVSSVELLAIFIALELSSFTTYLLVPMREEETGRFRFQMEAGAKYLLFGVMATGFMLFGMSYIFGLTGSTHLTEIAAKLPSLSSQPVAVVGIALFLAGFFYKLALFPFHFWVPDVYEGATNETTAFIATIPKLAAVALLTRIISLAHPTGDLLTPILMVCALLSMFYGNLSALVQKDFKRMLGFSGIAHAGFVLLGLLVFRQTGYAHALYYISGYVVMTLACFLVLCAVSQNGENVAIADMAGLSKRSPLLAATLLVGLFALAGIPPFVGFMGKFFVLVDALNEGYVVLTAFAAINTAIAIYYYLSVVRTAFCSSDEEVIPITTTLSTKVLSVLLMAAIIAMGIFPSAIVDTAQGVIQAIL